MGLRLAKKKRKGVVEMRQKEIVGLTTSGISQCVSRDLQILPNYQSLYGAHVQCFERVHDTVAVLPGIERDLVEVFLDQALLLHELDVCERVGCQFDRL